MKRYTLSAAGVLALLALAGCAREPDVEPIPQGKKIEAAFRLNVKQPLLSRAAEGTAVNAPASDSGISVSFAPATRAGGNALTEEQEFAVNNLWVIQFDDNGDKLVGEYMDAPEKVTEGGSTYYKSTATLEETGDAPATLFFIANAGPDAGFDGSFNLDGFKAMSHSLATEQAVGGQATDDGSDPGIVMSGRWHTDSGLTASTEITAEVERLAARLSVNVTNHIRHNYLEITSMRIESVASRVSYYNEAASYGSDPAWTYPDATAAGNFFDYAPISFNYEPVDDGQGTRQLLNYTWYVTENRQGTGTVSDETGKWAGTDPSFLATGVSRATRITLSGIYHDNSGDGIITKPMTITVYPGENETTDFNVIRNADYRMNITINSIDTNDPRVEYDPEVTFNYYYYYIEDNFEYPILLETDKDFTGLKAGDRFVGNTSYPEIDYTAKPVLNKYKDLLVAYGHGTSVDEFEDGMVRGFQPETVSSTEEDNVVNIYYYKKGVAPQYHMVTFCVVNTRYSTLFSHFTLDNVPENSTLLGVAQMQFNLTYGDGSGTVIDILQDYGSYFSIPGGASFQGYKPEYSLDVTGSENAIDVTVDRDYEITVFYRPTN